MTNYNKVIWSEGMFLRHEHFQQQERYLESLTILPKKIENKPHFYGFSLLEIENDLLPLGRFRLSKFAGIFPDGTTFHHNTNCSALEAIDIPKEASNCIVYLCVPLQSSSQVAIDTPDSSVFLARYRVQNVDVPDSNTSGSEPYNMAVGQLSTRLLLETQDRSQYACLALAKIKEVSIQGEVVLDQDFIPTCINAKVSDVVKAFLEKLHTAILNRCDDLSLRLNRPERYETTYITDFMMLQILCRYRNLTLYWYKSDYIHPETLYIELLKLEGELAVFTQKTMGLDNLPLYRHQDLQATYSLLMDFILERLLSILNQRAIQLELVEQEPGRFVAKTGDWAQIDNIEIVLAIKAEMHPEALQHAVQHQIKIAPVEVIETLITSHLPGIDGRFLSVTPPELPFHSGYSYFNLNKSNEFYKKLSSSIGLSIHVGGKFDNLDLTVWVIKK